MTIKEYFSDKSGSLLLQLVSMAALAAFLIMSGTSAGVVAIIAIVWALGFVIFQTVAYQKLKVHLTELEIIMTGLDQKYLFVECIGKPNSHYERRLYELMRRSGKSMIETVSDAQAAGQEYREYIESWVHEIKAPLTAAELIAQGLDAEARRKLMRELEAVESHVERALFYARAESAEKDFLIRQAELSEIVAEAVEKHRSLLIGSGVQLRIDELDQMVYTDSKWAVFLLGQLLQNAVRYRSESPVITISAKSLGQQTQLVIVDNGIGIPTHELPRIFDRGFTGSNGRVRGGSTGMGLYICRRLAALLSLDLQVGSTEREGTTITMTFPSKVNLSKV
ncbi:sensor histidine kinase [Ohessyouella blattaphilus]|uniref:histidine kinase n=1 Tax=Ohessyouella blattaphilus TaxID=2949333 RepID=A0ABT1EGA0_9FIRM|nr:sensor histidine kinase [Ohessyouella blattaphilus]MCP1109734.1 sensor histidine kinase [Ohessyouella blattaphilus]MCR8563128.1 sensor histidine kinase [Ohessyouella blattaphilus]